MGINILKPFLRFNWKSRNLITSKDQLEFEKIWEIETILETLFGPLQISKIEIHYQARKVIIEIRGTVFEIKKIEQNKKALKLITYYFSIILNIPVEILLLSVPTITFSAKELAKWLKLKLNKNPKITEVTKIGRNLKKLILFDSDSLIKETLSYTKLMSTTTLNEEKSKKNILGIRIIVKGLSGKMARSKKIIFTIGSVKLNSSDSVIDSGFTKYINKKGIIGIKIWISYKPELI